MSVVLGVLMNLAGSVGINLGTNLLKFSHSIADKRQRLDAPDEEVVSRPFVWYVAISLFVGGSLVNFASFSFAPQSLLAALGSVQFVSNVLFGALVLGETVTRRILAGTLLIVGGNVLVVLNSATESETYDAQALWALYDSTYKAYLFVLCLLGMAAYVTYKRLKHAAKAEGGRGPVSARAQTWLPVLYVVVSAAIGTQSVLQAKCLSELLRETASGSNQLTQPFTYGVVVAWLSATGFWMHRMNRGLAKFDGLFIVPLFQVGWTMLSILGGGVYFKEFDSFTELQYGGFAGGVWLVFCGVYLLAPPPPVHGRRRSSIDGMQLPVVFSTDDAAAAGPAATRASAPGARQRAASIDTMRMAVARRETRAMSLGMAMPIPTADELYVSDARPSAELPTLREVEAAHSSMASDSDM